MCLLYFHNLVEKIQRREFLFSNINSSLLHSLFFLHFVIVVVGLSSRVSFGFAECVAVIMIRDNHVVGKIQEVIEMTHFKLHICKKFFLITCTLDKLYRKFPPLVTLKRMSLRQLLTQEQSSHCFPYKNSLEVLTTIMH